MRAKHQLFAALFLLLTAVRAFAAEYAIGADLSFLKQAEDSGFVFKDNGTPRRGLQIFKDHGYNWVRLRIFNNPTALPNNLQYTIASAQSAKKLGFQLLLDFHYSDGWADPGQQWIPAAWKSLNHQQLVQAVFAYTRDTITAFREAGVMPDMVQLGNEITNGMLWPDGRLPEHWDNFAALEQAGIAGVEAGKGILPRPRILVHIDKGGDPLATATFFDQLNKYHLSYDVIGQSYYPWWHGSLLDLRDNLLFMAKTYDKDILIAETAYDWRPTEYRDARGPFPETPEGQEQFLRSLNQILLSTAGRRILGLFWWEPAVAPGTHILSRGFFDDNGNSLPVLSVFDKFTRGKPTSQKPQP